MWTLAVALRYRPSGPEPVWGTPDAFGDGWADGGRTGHTVVDANSGSVSIALAVAESRRPEAVARYSVQISSGPSSCSRCRSGIPSATDAGRSHTQPLSDQPRDVRIPGHLERDGPRAAGGGEGVVRPGPGYPTRRSRARRLTYGIYHQET
jgi:hypothetical protein